MTSASRTLRLRIDHEAGSENLMEQRPLRLGDLVDDYCPRERRLTNHAVVAIVGESIRQTRCSTCDAEHPFKGGKVPRRRKKDEKEELFDQVLVGAPSQLVSKSEDDDVPDVPEIPEKPAIAAPSAPERREAHHAPIAAAAPVVAKPAPAPAPAIAEPESNGAEPANGANDDYWPAHRRLIRAQLPKTEGQQPVPRPIHEFTMRQPGRGHSFRDGGGRPGGGGGGENRGNNQRGGGFRGGQGGGGGRQNRPGGGRGKGPR